MIKYEVQNSPGEPEFLKYEAENSPDTIEAASCCSSTESEKDEVKPAPRRKGRPGARRKEELEEFDFTVSFFQHIVIGIQMGTVNNVSRLPCKIHYANN